MKNNTTLSIVIPTIGRKALEKTIGSVLAQSVMPDEIIVWDNSGTGAAQKDSVYAAHPAVKWQLAGSRKMIVDSWNTAVGFCSCDFVFILGDDDILLPDFVKTGKAVLQKGAKLVHVENQVIDAEDNIRDPNDRRSGLREMSHAEYLTCYSTGNEINIYLSSLIFPRETFHKIGGFKDFVHNGLAMDVLFNIELLHEIGNITVIFTPLWQYRTFISDWCGAVRDPENIPVIAREYLTFRDQAETFFTGDLKPVFRAFNRKRITSQIVGVCYPASPWKTLKLIFSPMFSLYEKITMLRDFFYMLRH